MGTINKLLRIKSQDDISSEDFTKDNMKELIKSQKKLTKRLRETEEMMTQLRLHPDFRVETSSPRTKEEDLISEDEQQNNRNKILLSSEENSIIKTCLEDIPDYDGKSDPEIFIEQIKALFKKLSAAGVRPLVQSKTAKRIITKKLKNNANIIGSRIKEINCVTLRDALRMEFGRRGKTFDKLT